MREVVFLKKNEDKWREIEQLIKSGTRTDPDHLANLLIELTDDLSYAQTHYPESKISVYLNGLTSAIYQAIYQNKREKTKNRFISFWLYELPLEFRKAHKLFLLSFIFFVTCMIIGAVSTAYDDSFAREILGNRYVSMTIKNIKDGDPMAVYKDSDETFMFLRITWNNIQVSLLVFAAGVFFSLGTYYFMFTNGVMVGTFQWFFYKFGLLWTSFLTVWIHGTIEISSIIIAGASGIMIGNSILYPGTYSRKQSFIRGAKRSVKIIIGLIPLFIIAGLLESFVTRHTEWHWMVKLGIILLSLSFILTYFVFYPIWLTRKKERESEVEE